MHRSNNDECRNRTFTPRLVLRPARRREPGSRTAKRRLLLRQRGSEKKNASTRTRTRTTVSSHSMSLVAMTVISTVFMIVISSRCNCCSAFVFVPNGMLATRKSSQRERSGASFFATTKVEPLTTKTTTPTTTPRWRDLERRVGESEESPLVGSFHPKEHIFIMQVDDGNNEDKSSSSSSSSNNNNSEKERSSFSEEDNSIHEEESSALASAISESKENTELLEQRRKAQARAALLAKRGRGRSKSKASPRERTTSVGARRVGSATRSRLGGSATSQLMDGLRKTAQGTTGGATTPQSAPEKNSPPKDGPKDPPAPPTSTSASTAAAARISQGIVTAAIEDLLQSHIKNTNYRVFPNMGHQLVQTGKAAAAAAAPTTTTPSSPVSIRLATPHDDVDIASLRLSVFSDFTTDLQNQFCARSCQAIAARRRRGATCFVATANCRDTPTITGTRSDVILGSAECSSHEFAGTRLGRRRLPRSILYVTEVAVSPSARRRGVGARLLSAIDELAKNRCVETLYLHVDVENHGALRLYEKAGYRKIQPEDHDPMYSEFTKSLNLHPGATKGREHFLLYKNIVPEPIWLEDTHLQDQYYNCSSNSRSNELVGVLGFEIPA